jgi:hypothetical protein
VFLPETRYCSDQTPPLLQQRQFRQQNEKPHERIDLCRGLLGGESEAILIHGARNRSPELHQILRRKIQHFIPLTENIQRSFG